jgi:ABC-type uncharacterized transport system substrate-binding protein
MFVKVLHYHFFQRVKGLDTKVVVGKHLTKYEVNRVVNLVILFFFCQGVTQLQGGIKK